MPFRQFISSASKTALCGQAISHTKNVTDNVSIVDALFVKFFNFLQIAGAKIALYFSKYTVILFYVKSLCLYVIENGGFVLHNCYSILNVINA